MPTDGWLWTVSFTLHSEHLISPQPVGSMTRTPHDATPRPWRSRFARLHPKAYLGLHAAGGALIIIALVWLFLAIADEIPEQSTLARMDTMVQHFLQTHGTEVGETIFFGVSYFGAPVLFVAVVATVLWFAWRRDWQRAGALALTSGSGVALSNVLKMVFHRGRPETATEFITRHTWSFPSGHAMNSMISYGFLALLLLEFVTGRRERIAVVVLTVVLIAAIGFSRLYLGVHYLSDVGGGWIAGAAWLLVCASGYRFAQGRLSSR